MLSSSDDLTQGMPPPPLPDDRLTSSSPLNSQNLSSALGHLGHPLSSSSSSSIYHTDGSHSLPPSLTTSTAESQSDSEVGFSDYDTDSSTSSINKKQKLRSQPPPEVTNQTHPSHTLLHPKPHVHRAFPRPTNERPVIKLTRGLIHTYQAINEKFHLEKKRRRKRNEEARQSCDDEHHDLIIRDGIMLKSSRYRLISELGKGCFGVVAKALDTHTNQYVAVKIIKAKKPFYAQAQVEINVLSALNTYAGTHSADRANVVELKDVFDFRSHRCLVFELLSFNLYDLLKDSDFCGVSLRLIRKFAQQLLVTLRELRLVNKDGGVVHCDLKPENILLRESKRSAIKVIDFGSSCFLHKKMYTYIQSRFYRAPEVLLGLDYSCPIDMWSLGCILVEMHTGNPIFNGKNELGQMKKIVCVLGLPPTSMLQRGKKTKQYFTTRRSQIFFKDLVPKEIDGEFIVPEGGTFPYGCEARSLRDIIRSSNHFHSDRSPTSEMDYLRFEDLVRKMLVYNPDERISPTDALNHSFFRQTQSTEVQVGDSLKSVDVTDADNDAPMDG